MDQILYVTDIETRKDKNERAYKVVKVQTYEREERIVPGKGKVLVRGKEVPGSFIVYPENYLGKPDQYWDVTENEAIFGDIVKRAVEPYEIPDASTGESKVVNTYTCVVFGRTTDPMWEQTVQLEFKRRGHNIVYGSVSTPTFNADQVRDSIINTAHTGVNAPVAAPPVSDRVPAYDQGV